MSFCWAGTLAEARIHNYLISMDPGFHRDDKTRINRRFPGFSRQFLTLLWMLALAPVASAAFNPGTAPFRVLLNNASLDYRITMRSLLPGARLHITLPDKGSYRVQQGKPLSLTNNALVWTAPSQPGNYPILISRPQDGASVQVQVFVLQPMSQVRNGRLNGYRIGAYPRPLQGLESYRTPSGFIEVSEAMLSLPVSPHFRLGQFLCKQASGFPKYLVLEPRLLIKLELLLQDLNTAGIRTDSLEIMSGYRTPWYNRSIGNVANSRHVFGGAADVYVDVNPADGQMDDLNGDGKISLQDASWLYRLADELVDRHQRPDLTGGVGRYDRTPAHGPFVHIDTRGTRARWGY